MQTQLKELDPKKIEYYGKFKETSSLLDDGTDFIKKEKTKLIMKKFKTKYKQ